MADTIRLQGGPELIAKLQNMAKKGAKACLRKSTRKGANVILKEYRSINPPNDLTGRWRKGLKLKPKTSGNRVSTWVRSVDQKAFWEEYGTQERHHKSGKSVGKMPAAHPGKRVVADVGQQALDVTVADLAIQIETTLKADGNGPAGE